MAFRLYEDHVADILVSKGSRRYASPVADWDITVGKMLDVPNRQVTIYKTGGLANNPRWLIDYPSIQVKVRGGPNDYVLANTKAQLLQNQLVGVTSFVASNGDLIDSIVAIGDVSHTGWDDEKRPEFTFNLRLIAEPLAANLAGTNREQL